MVHLLQNLFTATFSFFNVHRRPFFFELATSFPSVFVVVFALLLSFTAHYDLIPAPPLSTGCAFPIVLEVPSTSNIPGLQT